MVRHAESEDNSANTNLDPDRNNEGIGVSRALDLGSNAVVANVAAVYVTRYCRTAQTGQPTALAYDLPLQVQRFDGSSGGVDNCDPLITARVELLPPAVDSSAVLANRVLKEHAGDVVLVVGHSNTIPEIVEALGAPSLCPTFFTSRANGTCRLPAGEFDNLFVVTVPFGPGDVSVTRQKY
ncbi:MAG: hypothetical protein O7E57_09745 [Gammaproteobacteria bacterium]|nr:hypothetical protein [Gammaproteobacteria bacterium]